MKQYSRWEYLVFWF